MGLFEGSNKLDDIRKMNTKESKELNFMNRRFRVIREEDTYIWVYERQGKEAIESRMV